MSGPAHSRVGDVPSYQPSSDPSYKVGSLKLASSIHGEWKDSLVRGLMDVFDSLVTRPVRCGVSRESQQKGSRGEIRPTTNTLTETDLSR